MSRHHLLIGALMIAGALMLTACGGGDEDEKNGQETGGPTATVAAGDEQTAPTTVKATATAEKEGGGETEVSSGGDLKDVPIYSGAKEMASWGGSMSGAAAGVNEADYEKIVWKYYSSDDSFGDIAEWYRSEMKKDKYGWTETMWMDVPDQGSWGAWSQDNEKNVAWVYITKGDGESESIIVIMEGLNKK